VKAKQANKNERMAGPNSNILRWTLLAWLGCWLERCTLQTGSKAAITQPPKFQDFLLSANAQNDYCCCCVLPWSIFGV
jgi:hypothetical protein